MYEWFYVGQYGQLGPLSSEQMIELIESGVITAETYVWRRGMSEWVYASTIPQFAALLRPGYVPPPPPPPGAPVSNMDPVPPISARSYYGSRAADFGGISSPCSRIAAGVMQILLPGVGRMYLGYTAIGVLQLLLTICTFGLLWIWPFIDGILILAGTVKYDGYGRLLQE